MVYIIFPKLHRLVKVEDRRERERSAFDKIISFPLGTYYHVLLQRSVSFQVMPVEGAYP